MNWQLVTEDNPAPKSGRMFIACWHTEEYISPEYPIWWDKRKDKWVNWPERAPQPTLMYLFPSVATFFKEN